MADKIFWNDLSSKKQFLGNGSFGEVFKASWYSKGLQKNIVIKRFRYDTNDCDIEKEVEFLSIAKHENIVMLYGTVKDENERTVMLMEYAECGSLHKMLHSKENENKILPHSRSINWMLQCAKGLKYLHNLNPKILHRDLKPENLLLFNNFRTLKICDFGTVKQLVTMMTEGVGTVTYMAPEVCNITSYSEKCDVYSFGITFWEVMSRKKPFYHLKGVVPLHIQKKVVEGDRPPLNEIQNVPNCDEIIKLIEHCWNGESGSRPTMHEVIDDINSILKTNKLDECDSNNSTFENFKWEDIALDVVPIDNFTMVYKATWRTESEIKTIAAKRFNNGESDRTIEFKACLKHENILDLYGITKDNDERTVLLMEYADCGSLENFLLRKQYPYYSYMNSINLMHQCAKGIEYLHEQNIIYCDLMPSKLFLANNFQTLKILFSQLSDENRNISSTIENFNYYRPPEVQHGNQFLDKSDIYSFGLILGVVITQERHFDIQSVSREGIFGLCLENTQASDRIKLLIAKCCDRDPTKRPNIRDLILCIEDEMQNPGYSGTYNDLSREPYTF